MRKMNANYKHSSYDPTIQNQIASSNNNDASFDNLQLP